MTTLPTSSASNYTDDEIQAVVEQLVLSSITHSYDTLGTRRVDLTFNDVQQAAAGVFVLYPQSPYYILFLGVKRLNDQIAAEAALIDQLLASLQSLGRHTLPVQDVTPLFNIQASLHALGSAAVQRTGVFTDITKAPAYQRLAANTQVFLNGPGQNVKSGGNIVQTPQQARVDVPSLLTQITQAHVALVATVQNLAGGISDYNGVNLPSIVAASVINNSAKLVGADAAALDTLSPTDRLEMVRDVVLHLLATTAVVNTFGSFAGPSDFYTLDGLGTAYSDVNFLAEPAVATAWYTGSYSIIQGYNDVLDVQADGGPPFSITLNPSTLAELNGQAEESGFVIGDGVNPFFGFGIPVPNNNIVKVQVSAGSTLLSTYVATLGIAGASTNAVMHGTMGISNPALYGAGGLLDGTDMQVVVDGTSTYSVTFVAPATMLALASQIDAAFNIPPHGVGAAFDSGPPVALRLVSTNVGTAATVVAFGGTALPLLGFTAGQSASGANNPRTADQVAADIQSVLPSYLTAQSYSYVYFSGLMNTGAETPNSTWVLTGGAVADLVALGVTTDNLAHVLTGPDAGSFYSVLSVTSTSVQIQGVTTSASGVHVEIVSKGRKVRIFVSDAALALPQALRISVVGDTDASKNSLMVLGFANGIFSGCTPTLPSQVADDINSKTQAITAYTTTKTFMGPTRAHTDLTNPNLVTFAMASGMSAVSFSGTMLTFVLTAVDLGSLTVSTGDLLIIRSGAGVKTGGIIGQINGATAVGHALSVGDVLQAPSVFGASDPSATFEIGPLFSCRAYQTLTIADGPNNGTYVVDQAGDTLLDVLLTQALPVVRQGVTTVPVSMTASLGTTALTLSSVDTTTASRLVLQGTAAPLFFSTMPYVAKGSSSWMKLPSVPRGLQAGDLLEYFSGHYQTASSVYTLQQVVREDRLIQVGPDAHGSYIPNTASWQFSTQPPPFAKLHVGVANNFSIVQAALNAWLLNPVNQSLFLENYNRLVNPLLANQNPTAEEVDEAVVTMQQLYAFLTATAASALGQPLAQALDSIVQTYTISHVPAVDTMLKTFSEKGSDRAIDTLLQGQFSAFFAMGMDDTSYAGALQAATRDVARNDLPVRKIDRPDAQSSPLKASALSPDFEYTAASVSEGTTLEVDPPLTGYGETSSYGQINQP